MEIWKYHENIIKISWKQGNTMKMWKYHKNIDKTAKFGILDVKSITFWNNTMKKKWNFKISDDIFMISKTSPSCFRMKKFINYRQGHELLTKLWICGKHVDLFIVLLDVILKDFLSFFLHYLSISSTSAEKDKKHSSYSSSHTQ